MAAGATLAPDLSGEVPANATAAVLTVTVTQPKTAGFLTALGDGQAVPEASALDFTVGQTVASQVIVPLVNGKADFFNGSAGTIQLIGDLSGYITPGAPAALLPVGPARVADSRTGTGDVMKGPVPSHGTLALFAETINNPTGEQLPVQTRAVVLNVPVTQPKAAGFLTVYAGGAARPGTSSLDFQAGQTVAVQVTVMVPSDGLVIVFNGSGSTVQIVVDQQGEYISPS